MTVLAYAHGNWSDPFPDFAAAVFVVALFVGAVQLLVGFVSKATEEDRSDG